MVKVLVLSLDGYSGWVPNDEEVIELPDFSEKTVCQKESGGSFSSFEEFERVYAGFIKLEIRRRID